MLKPGLSFYRVSLLGGLGDSVPNRLAARSLTQLPWDFCPFQGQPLDNLPHTHLLFPGCCLALLRPSCSGVLPWLRPQALP